MFALSFLNGKLLVRDYYGDVNVVRVRLDSLTEPVFYYLDVDGDGKNDTLKIYGEQTGYWFVYTGRGEKTYIAGCDMSEGDENILEFAVGYVVSPHKPVVIAKIYRGVEVSDDRIYVVDMVPTVKGMRAEVLLDGEAGWTTLMTTIVRPNFIETRHFRGWVESRYIGNGDRFVEQKSEEWEK